MTPDELKASQTAYPDARRWVHAALLGWSVLAHYRPDREWEERRGSLVLHGSTRPGPALNYALVLGDVPADQVLSDAERFFGAGARYAVIVDVDVAPGVDRAFSERGWLLDEEEPALALAPAPDPREIPAAPPELSIQRVTTQEDLDRFFAVTGSGGRIYLPTLAAALDPDVAVLIGLLDGEVVATSRVACSPGPEGAAHGKKVADINGVVTLPEYRRRGYGTAMTWAAVKEAVLRGAGGVVLNASEMGLPVYRKMGFVIAGTHRTYLPPPASA